MLDFDSSISECGLFWKRRFITKVTYKLTNLNVLWTGFININPYTANHELDTDNASIYIMMMPHILFP